MSQEILSNLAIIAIENEIGAALDIDNIVQDFAESKSRRH